MKFLAVPSNRPERLASWLKTWNGKGGWDRSILVQDAPLTTGSYGFDYHYSWNEIDQELGADSWIISRQDSAIRCFGFLMAWRLGATSVLTLDDDCFPTPARGAGETLFDRHLAAMNNHPVWTPSAGYRTRGLPWRNLGTMDNVVANVGLWTGSGDPDALQELSGHQSSPTPGNRLIPHGQLVPVCGMNLCFKRRAIPLFYFPLMGRDQPYRRFDDIWAGVIAKRCMDALAWRLSVGEPFIDHQRASNPFANLTAEAPGIAANETFWQGLIVPHLAESAIGAMQIVGVRLRELGSSSYLKILGRAIVVWSELFAETPIRGCYG